MSLTKAAAVDAGNDFIMGSAFGNMPIALRLQFLYPRCAAFVDFLYGADAYLQDAPVIEIIALPSRTKKGGSRIVPYLKEGAGVVTTRGHIHYVVTEFGVAYLYGKNLRQRARALIDIAHPDDREHLERASRERFKVFPGI